MKKLTKNEQIELATKKRNFYAVLIASNITDKNDPFPCHESWQANFRLADRLVKKLVGIKF